MPQRITVLGSTGSIGTNTLDVIARHPDRFEVFALTGATQVDLMLRQCAQFKPRFAVMVQPDAAKQLQDRVRAEGLNVQVLSGAAALDEVSAHAEVNAVMAAIVGAAGIEATLAAIRQGKTVALANKESLVTAGPLLMAEAARHGARWQQSDRG
mgnify:CR=1 FL=1